MLPGLLIACLLLVLAAGLLSQLAIQPGVDSITAGNRLLRTIGWTTLQASLSTILSLLIGVLLAWALSHRPRFFGRTFFIALLSTALVLPTLVVVLGLVTLLGRSGWLNDVIVLFDGTKIPPFIFGFSGILIGHCYFNASFAARSLLGRFEAIPEPQRKLARSLGLSSWQSFKLIELPAIAASLPALATTIFLLCFTSFAIVLTLGGSPKYNTLEVSIYEAIKLDFDLGRALGLALTQLGIGAVLVALSTRFMADNSLIAAEQAHSEWGDKTPARILQWTIITSFSLLFILPLVAIAVDGYQSDYIRILLDKDFHRATVTSISIASISTLLVVAITVAMASAYTTLATTQRLGEAAASAIILRLLSFSSALFLAVPSLVLGLGFFLLARKIGGSYTIWSICALLTANVLMVLPFAFVTLAPAMIKAANRYDKLTFSLGVKGISRWRLIESVLLRSELVYIASIAFCMSLGDLGVIALFGSQDFVTLPWLLYQKMGSYRTQDAAGIASFMLLLTVFVFALLPRLFCRRKNATT
ncbi:hypothetical protein AB833_27465 [Chromatiales bacterium (ex Bugula neritina AB1)]|nr:hypothetical protein AB833_27465 [Chromatiales bacterium (ex Bugula neritina AB1)]